MRLHRLLCCPPAPQTLCRYSPCSVRPCCRRSGISHKQLKMRVEQTLCTAVVAVIAYVSTCPCVFLLSLPPNPALRLAASSLLGDLPIISATTLLPSWAFTAPCYRYLSLSNPLIAKYGHSCYPLGAELPSIGYGKLLSEPWGQRQFSFRLERRVNLRPWPGQQPSYSTISMRCLQVKASQVRWA